MNPDLDIPAFLVVIDEARRQMQKKKKAASRAPARRPLGRPPKVELWLADEIPAIGSGQRWVTVDAVGRKWVWIKYGYRRNRIRVARQMFEHLIVRKEEDHAKGHQSR